jgi:hypothetical protein
MSGVHVASLLTFASYFSGSGLDFDDLDLMFQLR